jgi:hypothetical protein
MLRQARRARARAHTHTHAGMHAERSRRPRRAHTDAAVWFARPHTWNTSSSSYDMHVSSSSYASKHMEYKKHLLAHEPHTEDSIMLSVITI